MHKDLKIGLALGLILVIIAVIRLATDPRLSPKARMLQLHNVTAREELAASPNDFSQAELPESDYAESDLALSDITPEKSTIMSTEIEQPSTDETQSEPTDSVQYMQAEKIKTQKFHIVRKDQTLSSISMEYYGSAGKWKKIFDANRDVIKDANKIKPGTKIIIPD